jgi:hypothetical protein
MTKINNQELNLKPNSKSVFVVAAVVISATLLFAFQNCSTDGLPEQSPPSLSSLTIPAGTLTPAFDPAVTSYTVSVGFLTTSVTLTPANSDSAVSITVNGNAVTTGASSGTIDLTAGAVTALTVVLTKNGLSKTYTIDVTRASAGSFAQQAYVKASNTGGDIFGSAVAIDGNTMAVGAENEDSNATGIDGNQADNSAQDSGAVYIFTRSGNTWTQQAYIKASNTGVNDKFGTSLDLDGDTLVVGATAEDSNATGVNGNQADNSASSSGAAYVFVRNGTTWAEQAYIKASNTEASDLFGFNVAAGGDSVVVSSYSEDSSATGIGGNEASNATAGARAVYVFK